MERTSRAFEELDGTRLLLEELRELLDDHFGENARGQQRVLERMDRLEQYTILSRFVTTPATIKIEADVTKEHIERVLREDLVTQRGLWSVYQKNLNKAKLQIAKFGESVALTNQVEEYEQKLIEIEDAIEHIRRELEIETKTDRTAP